MKEGEFWDFRLLVEILASFSPTTCFTNEQGFRSCSDAIVRQINRYALILHPNFKISGYTKASLDRIKP